MAQLAIEKGIKFSQDGTLYSECLAHVRSQPKVWKAVKHIRIQKELPQDVFESIKAIAMFSRSGAGAKEDALEMSRRPVIALANKYKLRREGTDSSKSSEATPVFSGTNRVVLDSREPRGH